MVILCAGCNPFVSSSKTDVGFAPGVSKTTILGPFSSSWPFSSSTDYTYDPAKIQFSGGVCSLKTLDQTDDDNDSTSGFDGGTHTGTQWSGVNSWVELTNLSSTKALPNSGSTSSWTSMNGSALLLHLDGTIGLIADASSVTDSSTSALNFTANNVNTAGMAFAAGKVDQGIIFDGTDDHLEHAYSATLNPNQFTAMLWVMPTGGAGTIRVPMASRSTAGASFRGYSIAATAADIWQVSIGTGAGAWTTLTATNVVLNAWTHLALTYDGTTATFYVDGVDKGSANIAFLPNPDRPTRIGAGTTEGVASGFLQAQLTRPRYSIELYPQMKLIIFTAGNCLHIQVFMTLG